MSNQHPTASRITARLFIDPSCPWGYSASPALRTIEWRYRDQIEWELVMIGLSEPETINPEFTPTLLARFQVDLRDRYGMPFDIEPKVRLSSSSRSCQAVIAAKLLQPGSEWKTLRALQVLQFTTPILLDDDEQLRAALGTVEDLDADAIVDSLDSPEVQDAYRREWTDSRTAANGPTELQGKHADTPFGPRYTAPSVIFTRGDMKLEAGGFQPVEVYDAIIANLDPSLNRNAPAESPAEALSLYPSGLTTQEIAAIMAGGNDLPDRAEAERQLLELQGARRVKRISLGSDALWLSA